MKIKFILPALEEAKSPFWRPVKYSLFPPLGLATLASFCSLDDDICIVDEHVEKLSLEDSPDLVCIETYITNAYRSYEIADYYRQRGIHVALGGLHATSLPSEALKHADTVLIGMGEHIFPQFLSDLKSGAPKKLYTAQNVCLQNAPLPRRDLIKREKYLVPNSMLISRGCPNKCSFCYVSSFYKNGKSFHTYQLDRILQEIDSLPGRHLYFLDDHLFADEQLCRDLFTELKGMKRLFQGAVTVESILKNDLIDLAYDAGFRSAFIGFESADHGNLKKVNKRSNINFNYSDAIKRLDELGIMINGSFIFGLEHDTHRVFSDTAQWIIDQGITTATFHILTPYPGTSIYQSMLQSNQINTFNWKKYDTRHLVFEHPTITAEEMEHGYRNAYQLFYKWRNVLSASKHHKKRSMKLKHFLYAGAWKKCEPIWNFLIKYSLLPRARHLLEQTLK